MVVTELAADSPLHYSQITSADGTHFALPTTRGTKTSWPPYQLQGKVSEPFQRDTKNTHAAPATVIQLTILRGKIKEHID